MALCISPTLKAEFTPSVVKLTRGRFDGEYVQDWKTVYVPRHLMRLAMDHLSPVMLDTHHDKELVICEYNLWNVSLSRHNGNGYVCFNYLSEESLERLHWHSLNIKNAEFEELCRAMSFLADENMDDGAIGDQPGVDITPDMLRQEPMPYGIHIIPVYSWQMVDSQGVDQRTAGPTAFLNRDNCVADAKSAYPV